MFEGIKTGDWSNMVESIVKPLADTVIGGLDLGLFTPFAGGFLGAVLDDVLSGGGLFGGGKAPPSESTWKVAVQNWPEQLEAGIAMMPQFMLRSSTTITIQGGQADAKNLARSLKTQLALT